MKVTQRRFGKRSDYYATRDYPTHIETWVIMAASAPPPSAEPAYQTHGVQTPTGEWFLVFHDFHHTKTEAEHHLQDYYRDAVISKRGFWEVTL